MSSTVAVEGKAALYVYFSIAITFPVIVWPFIYPLLFSSFSESFYVGWIVSAGLVLLIAVVADSICSSRASLHNATVSWVWSLLIILFIAISLSLWNSIYLIAVMYFLHSLRSCLDLWCGRGGWWSWTAWIRDSLTSLMLFLWQPFLTLSP